MMRRTSRGGSILIFAILPLACAKAASTPAVVIEGFLYSPAAVEVQSSDTVIFTNRDVVPHTATAVDKSWDSGDIAPGESVRVLVEAAGEYFCAYHPTMKGSITTAQD